MYVLATGAMCTGILSRLITSSLAMVPTAMRALSRMRSLRRGVLSLVRAGLPQWEGHGIVHEYFKEASIPWGSWDDPEGLRHLSRSADTGERMQRDQEKDYRHQLTVIASGCLWHKVNSCVCAVRTDCSCVVPAAMWLATYTYGLHPHLASARLSLGASGAALDAAINLA